MFGQDNSQSQPADDNNGFTPPPLSDSFPPPMDSTASPSNAASADNASGAPSLNSSVVTPSGSSSNGGAAEDLVNIKQQALQQLGPLVGHLEQSPEEKFRTTMMMIQATDDKSLVKEAYEAAQAITDDKARAQALLDVINEINYFSQQK